MTAISSDVYDLTLATTQSIREPLRDPGWKLRLKWHYSGEECFDKFREYLDWLRSFIDKNSWVGKDVAVSFKLLSNAFDRQESEHGKINAVKEVFSKKAHSEVEILWREYRTIRRVIQDRSTQMVTLKTSLQANLVASSHLRQQSWTADATMTNDVDSPETSGGDPFLNPAEAI